jgi:hypothetical protein
MLSDRRVLLAGGMALALLAGLVLAAMMLFRSGPPVTDAEPARGLVVQTGRPDDVRLDPDHPLRCFVDGKSIGELPLRECAQKNGVATGALDVGLDPSGALAATSEPSGVVTPLPPAEDSAAQPAPADQAPPAVAPRPLASAEPAPCWRYGDGGWSRMPGTVPLAMCVRALFAGQCEPPGAVAYGRWGDHTVRLAGAAVQISDDNRNFRFLAPQSAPCPAPPGPE